MNEIEQHRITCRFTFFCCRYRHCYRIFQSKSLLNAHQNQYNHFVLKPRTETKQHKHERRHRCGMCNKAFGKAYDLRIHLRTHNNLRKEKCEWCQKAFCDPATLRKHIKHIHCENGLIQKPFVCRKCHKRFRWKHSLKTHLETQHKNVVCLKERRIYKCPANECEVSFTYKSNCNAHFKKFHANIVVSH
eukprot:57722_1